MNDRIRISDADRDRVTARLRDHFADGRLTAEELDERITAALNAKTFGDLRGVLADLPEPPSAPPAGQRPPAGGPRVFAHRRPRLLPFVLLALLLALLLPGGGWLIFLFIRLALVFFLVACLAGILAASRFRRRMRRTWGSAYGHYENTCWTRGHHHRGYPYWRV